MIAEVERYSVTGDSVKEGDVWACAVSPFEIVSNVSDDSLVIGRQWEQREANDAFPRFHSSQLLVDALYNLAVDDIDHNYSTAGGFNTYGDHENLYGSLLLSLAMLDPASAMTTLESAVDSMLVVEGEGTWPVCDDRLGWVVAAWEVYCATGDTEWLEWAYRVSCNTIDEQCLIQADPTDGLLHGIVLSRYLTGDYFPSWAGATDLAEVEMLQNNILAIRAMDLANEMAYELDVALPYEQEAQRLREAVNQHFWFEAHGRYTAYRLGIITHMPTPLTDNTAQSLATLWDIADDDRSSTFVEHTPMCVYGMPPHYPIAIDTELYLTYPAWALSQSLWSIAAASVNNEAGVRHGLAALIRALAFYAPRHLSRSETRLNDLANASAMPAVVLRLLAGIRLLPDGIEFQPFVPSCLPGVKTILGFSYRSAQFDITLNGTGNSVEQLLLDGEPVEGCFVPATLEGHHNILIELADNHRGSENVTTATIDKRLLRSPAVDWRGDQLTVKNWTIGTPYKLLINGDLAYSFTDSVFRLPAPLARQGELSVVAVGRYERSVPSRTSLVGPKPAIRIVNADSLHLADTLTVEVTTERAGNYVLQAEYWCEAGCPVVIVEANGHRQGSLVLPAAAEPSPSNRILVQLLRGKNRLRLVRYCSPEYTSGIRSLSVFPTN